MTEAPGERHLVTVGPEEAGERLDRLLARRLPALSRSRLKQLIDEGHVSREGAAVTAPAQKVRADQTFAIFIPETVPARLEAQAIALAVIYEDEDIIVVDKPAGLVVHPAPGNPDRTLVNALIAHCGDSLRGIGGVRRPGIVHRLDKDTSGLLVAAKSDAAHRDLVAQFAARSIERAYAAFVWGLPVPAKGEIAGNIGRSPRNRKKMALVTRGGRPALTRYRVRQAFAGGAASLVECRLATGRTHQIRVHLSARGHPVIGDRLYGRAPGRRLLALPAAAESAVSRLGRQALHAERLGFRHPGSGRELKFDSQLPTELKGLKSCLETL